MMRTGTGPGIRKTRSRGSITVCAFLIGTMIRGLHQGLAVFTLRNQGRTHVSTLPEFIGIRSGLDRRGVHTCPARNGGAPFLGPPGEESPDAPLRPRRSRRQPVPVRSANGEVRVGCGVGPRRRRSQATRYPHKTPAPGVAHRQAPACRRRGAAFVGARALPPPGSRIGLSVMRRGRRPRMSIRPRSCECFSLPPPGSPRPGLRYRPDSLIAGRGDRLSGWTRSDHGRGPLPRSRPPRTTRRCGPMRWPR